MCGKLQQKSDKVLEVGKSQGEVNAPLVDGGKFHEHGESVVRDAAVGGGDDREHFIIIPLHDRILILSAPSEAHLAPPSPPHVRSDVARRLPNKHRIRYNQQVAKGFSLYIIEYIDAVQCRNL